MADFAIGQAFVKGRDVVVRAAANTGATRLYPTRSAEGVLTLPTGVTYVLFQGATQASFQVSDNNTEFRLLGDDGWSDSTITGSSVRASMTAYFQRNVEAAAGGGADFRGEYSEDFELVQRARYDKNFEVYFEFLKYMGTVNDGGANSGQHVYDVSAMNGVIMNYNESQAAENLIQVSFDVMSRGKAVFGRLQTATQINAGAIQ